tara:strand:+ start:6206 stop:6658 length:453 start_codon:yes stop_codon:yes gene_type:complete
VDTEDEETDGPVTRSRLRRALLLTAGLASVGLGMLGAFLPILPTTPFLILGAACLARSSPTWHRRLLANRVVGPYLAQWNRDHTVPRRAKRKAYVLVVVTFAVSVYWVDQVWMRWVLVVVGGLLLLFLTRLRTTHETAAHVTSVAADDEA